jgi:hypothetical protein
MSGMRVEIVNLNAGFWKYGMEIIVIVKLGLSDTGFVSYVQVDLNRILQLDFVYAQLLIKYLTHYRSVVSHVLPIHNLIQGKLHVCVI